MKLPVLPVSPALFVCSILFGQMPSAFAQPVRCAAGKHRQAGASFFYEKQSGENLPAAGDLTGRAVVTIPVVVHVVWNKNEENIPNEQILSQIEVLNRDFRAANAEIPGIPAIFQDKIADVEIEFCLASKDPAGNLTTGITRTYTDNSAGIGATSLVHYTNQGGRDAWDPAKYLNIWVANGGGVGGKASFPGEGPPAEDGVMVDYRQFGDFNTGPPYNLGRTCTHEIGHYFNLEHVWGPSITSCCDEDDFVADTPNSCETYLQECPVHPVISCTEPDMFMNFMFYTDDACMGMFTHGQKARMLAALSTFRPGLLTSDACGPVSASEAEASSGLIVFQNPGNGRVAFEIKTGTPGRWQVQLADFTGRQLASVEVLPNVREQLEPAGIAPGIYVLTAVRREQRLVKKVVLIK